MTISAGEATVPIEHTDRFFIGGQWVTPSSESKINVIDSRTEQVFLASSAPARSPRTRISRPSTPDPTRFAVRSWEVVPPTDGVPVRVAALGGHPHR